MSCLYGTSRCSTKPVAVAGGTEFRTIAGGQNHTCGTTGDNRTLCWGYNRLGQLGNGTQVSQSAPAPTQLPAGTQFVRISAGREHTCGATAAGEVFCWGEEGTIGDGTRQVQLVPTRAALQEPIRPASLSAGGRVSCALTNGGTALCWGANSFGATGVGSQVQDVLVPTRVAGNLAFATIAVGGIHSCALDTTGVTYCWGWNSSGQLGDGTRENRTQPTRIRADVRFNRIAAGYEHTCALTADNRAYCWGKNAEGELGDGTREDRLDPVAVAGGLSFAALAAGASHTCGITEGNLLYCWGANSSGQLGTGNQQFQTTPQKVLSPQA